MVENSAFNIRLAERLQDSATGERYVIVQKSTYELQRVTHSHNSLTGTLDGAVVTIATSPSPMQLYRVGCALAQVNGGDAPEWHPGWDAA